jgi:hypothetical protein
MGPAFAGYYAISERVHGVPLESVGAAQWTAVVPALVSALEAMRLTDLSATAGFGGWAGIFDWGCSLYGDHLYNLAWFEFWGPWHPGLNVAYLRSELERRWREVGYAPADKEARLMARYLHIGLDHLAYNAYREIGLP